MFLLLAELFLSGTLRKQLASLLASVCLNFFGSGDPLLKNLLSKKMASNPVMVKIL